MRDPGRQGQEAGSAAGALHGLEVAGAFVPDVTLGDIGMPGLDGYQVARQWRRNPMPQATGLIVVTDYGHARDQALAREAGFDRPLTKPSSAETLLDLVEALAHRRADPVAACPKNFQRGLAERQKVCVYSRPSQTHPEFAAKFGG